jgi:hypothetical protein
MPCADPECEVLTRYHLHSSLEAVRILCEIYEELEENGFQLTREMKVRIKNWGVEHKYFDSLSFNNQINHAYEWEESLNK